MLSKLVVLQRQHTAHRPDRRMSIQAAVFLLALNDKERELLRLRARGLSDREIATQYFISIQSVRERFHRIACKLRLKGAELRSLVKEWELNNG